MKVTIRAIVFLGSAFAALVCSGLALAQSTYVPPPVRPSVDQNGVNLVTGVLDFSLTDITIGQVGAGGLSFSRTWNSNNPYITHNYLGIITTLGSNGTYSTATVSIGNYSELFTKADSPSTSPYVSSQGTGATLTANSTTYTYTGPDGTVSVFSKSITIVAGQQGAAFISSMTLPNGEIRTFNYLTGQLCLNQGCTQSQATVRLQSVTNNLGYQIKLLYRSNNTPFQATDFWTQLWGVMGINMAVDYCAPLATACTGTTQTWPTASYAYVPGTGCFASISYPVTDALGGYTCVLPGSPFTVQTPGHSSPNITYTTQVSDSFVNQVVEINRNGKDWKYFYSTSGTVATTRVTDPLNRDSIYTFDTTTNALTGFTNPAGEQTRYANDTSGRPTTVTLPTGGQLTYLYDARGNITEAHQVAYPAGSGPDLVWKANYPTTCTAPKTCNKPTYTRDAAGSQTDYTYDSTSGMVATITQPAPVVGGIRPAITNTYTQYQAYYKNSAGNIVASGTNVSFLTRVATCRTTSGCTATSGDQLRTDITYGSTGVANNRLAVTSTNRDGAGTLVASTTYGYDAIGNTATIDGPLGSSVQRVAMTYDALRRLTGSVGPDPDGSGPRQNIGVLTTYDARGFPTTVAIGTLPGQTAAAWQSFVTSQVAGRQFDDDGRVTLTSASAAGSMYSLQQSTYDNLGRLQCAAVRMNRGAFSGEPTSACTQGSPGSDGPDRIVQYGFDNSDRLQSVFTGVGTSSQITKQLRAYYPGGLLNTLTDGNGFVTTYSYDAYSRQYQIHYPDLTTVGASSATDYEQYGYDVNSNVVSVRRRSGDTIQTPRDLLGRMTTKILPGNAAESVYYSYDNQGRVLGALYNNVSGNGITLAYDGLGRAHTKTAFGRQLTYGYDLAGRRTQLIYPDSSYSVSYGYSNVDELLTVSDTTGTLATYTYDALGFRTQLTRPNTTTTLYTPNANEQLQQLTQDLAGTSLDSTEQFTYNAAGQIATKTQSNDGAYTWIPSPLSQSISSPADKQNKLATFQGVSVGHDTNAEINTGLNGLSYVYDVIGQLRQAISSSGTVTVAYDPAGMLRSETNGGTTTQYLYDGGDLIAEYDVNGNLTQRFVHGATDDEPLVWYQGATVSTSNRTFLHADERGSVIAASNSAGVATSGVKYGTYGESGALVSPFGYTGQLYMPDLQLYYYKARMYSPQTGRFIQPDPIGYKGGANLYGYAAADSVNLVDSSGLAPFCYWEQRIPPHIVLLNPQTGAIYGGDNSITWTEVCSGYGDGGGSSYGPPGGKSSDSGGGGGGGPQTPLKPCTTFADDLAARRANAGKASADAYVAATQTIDFVGSSMEITASLSKTLGRSASAADGLSKFAIPIAVGATVADAFGYAVTGDVDKGLNALLGSTALGMARVPVAGTGLALGMGMAMAINDMLPDTTNAGQSMETVRQLLATTSATCKPQ